MLLVGAVLLEVVVDKFNLDVRFVVLGHQLGFAEPAFLVVIATREVNGCEIGAFESVCDLDCKTE